ncbi:hypothetical protein B0H63DRAFT_118517 [Podospora didyma]|uniref:Uncharacterized protein n=1 Tax=Podospora didyma TaxID=330526 RepID=A0AAE0U4I5_9PEZI|nr:hypothetical protein B0H63DRAFT_118517 [Podospora didyma]
MYLPHTIGGSERYYLTIRQISLAKQRGIQGTPGGVRKICSADGWRKKQMTTLGIHYAPMGPDIPNKDVKLGWVPSSYLVGMMMPDRSLGQKIKNPRAENWARQSPLIQNRPVYTFPFPSLPSPASPQFSQLRFSSLWQSHLKRSSPFRSSESILFFHLSFQVASLLKTSKNMEPKPNIFPPLVSDPYYTRDIPTMHELCAQDCC